MPGILGWTCELHFYPLAPSSFRCVSLVSIVLYQNQNIQTRIQPAQSEALSHQPEAVNWRKM